MVSFGFDCQLFIIAKRSNEFYLCCDSADDLTITYKYDWTLIKKGNGKHYMNFTNSDLKFDNGRAHFKLDNLFNGDKLLGRSYFNTSIQINLTSVSSTNVHLTCDSK